MRIKIKIGIGLVFLSVFFTPFLALAQTQSWNNLEKSKHFLIYYQDAPAEYMNQLVTKVEQYYRSISDYLGFKRFDFWLWDNRCKIFLYPDAQSYLKATGASSWSRGHVQVIKKEISTYIGQEMFFDIILPHEIGHIIFREFVGYKKQLPLWLDEGVACMQERGSGERLLVAQSLVKMGLHTHLEELSRIQGDVIIIPFIFYSESASLVDFLLRAFGRSKFVDFCRTLRDNDDWLTALKNTYKLKNLEELEAIWVADLKSN